MVFICEGFNLCKVHFNETSILIDVRVLLISIAYQLLLKNYLYSMEKSLIIIVKNITN